MLNNGKKPVEPTGSDISGIESEEGIPDLSGRLKQLTDRILPGSAGDGRGRHADSSDVTSAYAEIAHLMMESLGSLQGVAEGLSTAPGACMAESAPVAGGTSKEYGTAASGTTAAGGAGEERRTE
ncbi:MULTISPECIES: hypothetical protein [unclassified Streptomyces]|uniref:hypothetical protein n=1 Tax=unclassified Streptomyces TaxID=2593676 RepID=UPI0011AFC8AF|nr:hypothetical protein [Streptomyces sp. CB02959]